MCSSCKQQEEQPKQLCKLCKVEKLLHEFPLRDNSPAELLHATNAKTKSKSRMPGAVRFAKLRNH
eukprot:4193464-Karenia_brevis.AAC.1